MVTTAFLIHEPKISNPFDHCKFIEQVRFYLLNVSNYVLVSQANNLYSQV